MSTPTIPTVDCPLADLARSHGELYGYTYGIPTCNGARGFLAEVISRAFHARERARHGSRLSRLDRQCILFARYEQAAAGLYGAEVAEACAACVPGFPLMAECDSAEATERPYWVLIRLASGVHGTPPMPTEFSAACAELE